MECSMFKGCYHYFIVRLSKVVIFNDLCKYLFDYFLQ